MAVIALALIAPASAMAGHDLVIYKKEAHVDLSSDEKAATVSCDAGDHALDGMWRIDHADQDDYVEALELISSAVDVIQATPTSDSTYSFTFEKNAIGRAQLKIFVTCLADKTQGGAHQHSFSTGFVDTAGLPVPASTFNTGTTPSVGDPLNVVKDTATATCPANTILVSPGYEATNFSGAFAGDRISGMMRLFESNSVTTARDWRWKWENSALPDATYTMDIVTKWRCLKIKVPQNGFDKHKLVPKWKNPKTFNPTIHAVSEGQYNCGDHYKAIVAGFRIPENNNGTDVSSYAKDGTGLLSTPPSFSAFNNVFYLGMDPRPKQRAYRFVNRSTSFTYPVILTALCLNYRTT